jgi:hypothetical protein
MFTHNGSLLAPEKRSGGSRSPSPNPTSLPPVLSPRSYHTGLPPVKDITLNPPSSNHTPTYTQESRTPSQDDHPLPQPPKMVEPTPRAGSPLRRMKGPRPLPVPHKLHASNASLSSALGGGGAVVGSLGPQRGGSGDTDGSGVGTEAEMEEDQPRTKPSRKALGKRRADPEDESECWED